MIMLPVRKGPAQSEELINLNAFVSHQPNPLQQPNLSHEHNPPQDTTPFRQHLSTLSLKLSDRLICCCNLHSPRCLLACLCAASFMQGVIINGSIPSTITTLEDVFYLRSIATGFIVSCYDIAFLVFCLPVSYFGGRSHKARWLGAGVFMIGVGSALYASPNFFMGVHKPPETAERDQMCKVLDQSRNDTRNIVADTPQPTHAHSKYCLYHEEIGLRTNFKYVFYSATLIMGAGATTIFTLAITYISENVPKEENTALYLGIYYTTSIFGPAGGFLSSAKFLEIEVNLFKEKNKSERTVSLVLNHFKEDEEAGAWWATFILGSMVCFVVAILLCAFPRRLRDSYLNRKSQIALREASAGVPGVMSRGEGSGVITAAHLNEVHQSPTGGCVAEARKFARMVGITDMWKTAKELATNKTYIFLNLAASSESLVVGGFITFAPKFIQVQYGHSKSNAAVIVGAIVVPIGGLATLVGGYLVKKFKLKIVSGLQFAIFVSIFSALTTFCFLLTCPESSLVWVNTPPSTFNGPFDRTREKYLDAVPAACDVECACNSVRFKPVCDVSESMEYVSPCHAGCGGQVSPERNEYTNCVCLPGGATSAPTVSEPRTHPHLTQTPSRKVLEQRHVKRSIRSAPSMPGPFQTQDGSGVRGLQTPTAPATNKTWQRPSEEQQGASANRCDASCGWKFKAWLVFFSLMVMSICILISPSMTCTLWSVPEKSRTIAIGVQWCFIRLLGAIPSGPLFGVMIDMACLLWEDNNHMSDAVQCGYATKTDANFQCKFYSNELMASNMLTVFLIAKGLTCCFITLAYLSARRKRKREEAAAAAEAKETEGGEEEEEEDEDRIEIGDKRWSIVAYLEIAGENHLKISQSLRRDFTAFP